MCQVIKINPQKVIRAQSDHYDVIKVLPIDQLSQKWGNYIPLDRKIYVNFKKELSHIIKIKLQRVIHAQSEYYDVMKIFLVEQISQK